MIYLFSPGQRVGTTKEWIQFWVYCGYRKVFHFLKHSDFSRNSTFRHIPIRFGNISRLNVEVGYFSYRLITITDRLFSDCLINVFMQKCQKLFDKCQSTKWLKNCLLQHHRATTVPTLLGIQVPESPLEGRTPFCRKTFPHLVSQWRRALVAPKVQWYSIDMLSFHSHPTKHHHLLLRSIILLMFRYHQLSPSTITQTSTSLFSLTCVCFTQEKSPGKVVSLCIHATSSYSAVRGFLAGIRQMHTHMHRLLYRRRKHAAIRGTSSWCLNNWHEDKEMERFKISSSRTCCADLEKHLCRQ